MMIVYMIGLCLVLFLFWLWLSSIRDEIRKTNQLLETLLKENQKK